MRLPLQVGLGSLALTSALPGHGRKKPGIDEYDFVYVQGLRLYDAEGLHYLTGKSCSCSEQTKGTNNKIRDELLGLYGELVDARIVARCTLTLYSHLTRILQLMNLLGVITRDWSQNSIRWLPKA